MDYKEVIQKIGNHPNDVMQAAFDREANTNSYYLYEIHRMHHQDYESYVWLFNSIEEFVLFLPAIVFNDIAVNCDNHDFEEEFGDIDYTEKYKLYTSLMNNKWDEAQCAKFVLDYLGSDELELIEFGKVADLLNISDSEFEKCKDSYSTIEEIEKHGLTQGKYKILNKFYNQSKTRPSLNQTDFFEMLENSEN